MSYALDGVGVYYSHVTLVQPAVPVFPVLRIPSGTLGLSLPVPPYSSDEGDINAEGTHPSRPYQLSCISSF